LSLTLGSFSGELFDARVYEGTSSVQTIREIGARCVTDPNDPVALRKRLDITRPRDLHRCDLEEVVDEYEVEPVGGRQTHGSGPFATLWLRPVADPLNPGQYIDAPEGSFDEEFYFQHLKIEQYQWERQYFENDMIGFNLAPYRMYTEDQVPEFAASFYNNPCRFIHQNNNLWDFEIVSGEKRQPLHLVALFSPYSLALSLLLVRKRLDSEMDTRRKPRAGIRSWSHLSQSWRE
jgi:hypothetical protein